MIRTKFFISLLLWFIAFSANAKEIAGFIQFRDAGRLALNNYLKTHDGNSYALASWKAADDFLITIFNNYVGETDPTEALQAANLPGWIYLIYGNQEKREKTITVSIRFYQADENISPIDRSQPFYLHTFKLYSKGNPVYFVNYDQAITLDGMREYQGFGTFRIIAYDENSKTYYIMSKFEETNFKRQIVDTGQYKDPEGKKVPYYLWGDQIENLGNGKYFTVTEDGSKQFFTAGWITPGPGSNHGYFYKTTWILTPSDHLYAKDFHWNIRDEYDEKTGKEIHKETIVKIKP